MTSTLFPTQAGIEKRHEDVDSAPRIVVAITGATGAIYGVRLLAALRRRGAYTHLVVSRAAWLTLHDEIGIDRGALGQSAIDPAEGPPATLHDANEVGASIASGSFRHNGMVIAPCSMKTLAAVAHGLDDNLVTRAADVTLKERRKLVLLARETPYTLAHLRNMTLVTEMGGIIMPPLPAFYAKPQNIDEMIDYTVNRVLDQLGFVDETRYARWTGLGTNG